MGRIGAVNLREVGKAAGVSHVTVSRVLRGEKCVTAATRERVLSVAKDLGYRANPLVRAYAEHMRRAGGMTGKANLGWIAAESSVERDGVFAWLRAYKAAAFERAAELGYAITDLSRQHAAMAATAFDRMLQARGISGLVVADFAMTEPVKADLSSYAIMMIGHGCLDEPFNRIVPDYQHDMRIIFDHLLELGYKRIGLHQTPYQMMITEGSQYAAYRFQQDRLPKNEHLPVFNEVSMKAELAKQLGRLVDWLQKERVEVLLLNHVRLANELRNAGLRIPEDLGVVHLGHGESPESPHSGIQYPVDHYGKAAIDLLSGELIRNERGLPPFPLKTAIAGDWRAGQTLRRPADSIHNNPVPPSPRATLPSLQWYIREFQIT